MSSDSINQIFPTLRILPVDKLLPHERCDPLRVLALEERLVIDHVLHNPPVVAALQDVQGNYIVLDGANRTRAFLTFWYRLSDRMSLD
jgi:hypothetical protein